VLFAGRGLEQREYHHFAAEYGDCDRGFGVAGDRAMMNWALGYLLLLRVGEEGVRGSILGALQTALLA
jgi:hypothetical protein